MTAAPKIRVAVITPNPTPYRVPFFAHLAQSPGLQLKVFFLTRSSATRPWAIDLHGFDHEFLPEWSIPLGGKDFARYRINPSIISRLRVGRFDVVVIAGYNHFTTQAAILYCILSRTPWCLMSESHVTRPRPPLRVFLKKMFLGPILRTMSAGMVTGTLARRYLESFGLPSDRIFLVANTPDIAWFRAESERLAPRRAEIRRRLALEGRLAVLFIGRLLDEKGLRVLFEAFSRVSSARPDAALLIVGDGRRRAEYESLVRSMRLPDVRFLGFRSQSELPEIYAASDVFVLPSLVEPWGVVVNEAMACSLPVVASDQVGASADLVKNGENGFVVPAADPQSLAARLLEILSDDSLRSRMRLRSLEIVSSWDYRMSAENFRLAVDAALKGRGGIRE